jgi:hypothetical protein
MAFLINAYNAFTVELILTKYPALVSIKDLGSVFSSPWKPKWIQLLGGKVSLDDIEHGMLRERGRFDDPRVHLEGTPCGDQFSASLQKPDVPEPVHVIGAACTTTTG